MNYLGIDHSVKHRPALDPGGKEISLFFGQGLFLLRFSAII